MNLDFHPTIQGVRPHQYNRRQITVDAKGFCVASGVNEDLELSDGSDLIEPDTGTMFQAPSIFSNALVANVVGSAKPEADELKLNSNRAFKARPTRPPTAKITPI